MNSILTLRQKLSGEAAPPFHRSSSGHTAKPFPSKTVTSFACALTRSVTAAAERVRIFRDMLHYAKVRVLDWYVGASSVEFCGEEALDTLARERCQAKVREALSEYVQTLRLTGRQRFILRYEIRPVRCDRCNSAFFSSRDRCPQCGQEASPVSHSPMVIHLQKARRNAVWSYRKAAVRRRKGRSLMAVR